MAGNRSQFVLFAQHGWADDRKAMAALAFSVTDSDTIVVAPSLGFIKTWIRIAPLIDAVEAVAIETLERYPELPIRIIGHSMGGLIWLEVLNRHPNWWTRVESLVLIGSPIGGADLGRLFDPLSFGIGIACDLGTNRRALAEAVAAQIPTLVIAGDIDGGSDGTVAVECTKVFGTEFVRLPGVNHADLRTHPQVAAAIRSFWALPKQRYSPQADFSHVLIRRIQSIPGMTDAHQRDFQRSRIHTTLPNGFTIRTWKNPAGIDHVYVASPQGTCLYGGFVGWMHTRDLHRTLADPRQEAAIAQPVVPTIN